MKKFELTIVLLLTTIPFLLFVLSSCSKSELTDPADAYIPLPPRPIDQTFLLADPLPNLVLGKVSYTTELLTLQVGNAGKSGAGKFLMTVSDKAGQVLASFPVAGLGVNQSLILRYTPKETAELLLTVDPYNTVKESNEEDNVKRLPKPILPYADGDGVADQ